jgi:hypothetical protein
MQTNGGDFQQKLSDTLSEVAQLSQIIYNPSDVNSIIAGIGTKAELFFKAVLFPNESPWRPFKYFINCLEKILDPEDLEVLHSFRRNYNLARHNPRFKTSLIDVHLQIQSVSLVMQKIFNHDVGLSNAPIQVSTKRVYWVTAWEHFVGIDTEIHIIVPAKSENLMGPPELDVIHIEAEHWDTAKFSMASVGKLDDWRGHIPEEYVSTWRTLGDFIEAVAFEGEYRELLTSLVQYGKEPDFLFGANRSDSSKSVLVACLVALVDVYSASGVSGSIVDEITQKVTSTYAVPSSAPSLQEIAEELAVMVDISWGQPQAIVGPLWASEEEFRQLKRHSISASEKLSVLIDENRRLIALNT